jgi:hypothetical protein
MDDFDILSDNQDKEMVSQWAKDNLLGKYHVAISKKTGGLKLRGDVIIKGCEDEVFFAKIESLNGSLTIEKCPNLTSLEGFLDRYMKFDGNLTINNCPKLTSLVGCPMIVSGSLSITGNTSLKSLEGCPEIVYGNVYVMKNGKRFSQDQINNKIKCTTRIVCSVEGDDVIEESTINEALNEPHLLDLVDQLKRNKFNIKTFFDDFQVEWDKIDSSQVKEYTKMDAKEKAKARNVIAKRDDIRGVILLKDKDDNYYRAISHRKDYLVLNTKQWGGYGQPYWQDANSTELMSMVEAAYSMVIITWGWKEQSDRYKKHGDRVKGREGMIENTPQFYEEMARQNIERYKKIIAQNKVNNMDAEIEKIDKDIEAITMKALKLAQEARKAASSNGYFDSTKIDNIMKRIYDRQHYLGYNKYGSNYAGDDGLLHLYSAFMQYYVRSKSGDDYNVKYMKEYKRKLLDMIKDLKTDMKI